MALVLLAALTLGAALWALGHLHHPWVKPHLVGAVLEQAGLVLDFRVLRLDVFSGELHAEGVTLEQPERFAALAPQWLSADTLDVRIRPREALAGQVWVERARAQGLMIAVVADESTDTFSLLFPSPDDVPEEPSTGLSNALDALRGLGVDVSDVELGLREAQWIQLEAGEVVQRATLRNLELQGHLHEPASGLDALLRVPAGVSELAFVQQASTELDSAGEPLRPALDLRSSLRLEASVTAAQALRVRVDAALEDLSGLDVTGEAPLALTAELDVAFDQAAKTTHLELRLPSVLAGLAHGHVEATVRDDSPDTLRDASGRVEVAFNELPVALPGVQITGAQAALLLSAATLSPRGVAGDVALDARVEQAEIDIDGQRLDASALRLAVRTRADAALDPGPPASPTTQPDAHPDAQPGVPPQAPTTLAGLAVELDARSFRVEQAGEPSLVAAGDALELRARIPSLTLGLDSDSDSDADADAAAAAPSGAEASAPDTLTATLTRLSAESGPRTHALLEAPVLRVSGHALLRALMNDEPLNGEARLDAEALHARSGADTVDLQPLHLQVDLHGLLLEGGGLMGLGGQADVALDASGRLRSGAQAVQLSGAAPRLHVNLESGAVRGDIPIASMRVSDGGETTLQLRGAALQVAVEHPMSLAPPAARGRVHVQGRIGHVESDVNSMTLPALDVQIDGRGGAYSLVGRGRVTHLVSGEERFEGTHRMRFQGDVNLRDHVYDFETHLGEPDTGDEAAPDAEASPNDESSPRLDLRVHAQLGADATTLEHTLTLGASRLAPLVSRFLPTGTQVSFDSVEVEGAGALMGLFASPPRSGRPPAIASDLSAALGSNQSFDMVLRNLHYATETQEADIEVLRLRGRVGQEEGVTVARVEAEAPTAALRQGRDRVAARGLAGTLVARVPDLEDPSSATLQADLRIASAEQNFFAAYPVRDVRLSAEVETTPVSITLNALTLENTAGRTRLELSGAYEGELSEVRAGRHAHAAAAIHGREALALEGVLQQDLAAFSGASFMMRSGGTLRVPMRVESGDMRTFHVAARVVAEHVFFTNIGVVVEDLNGEVPIEEVVTLLPNSVVIEPGAGTNALSRARFPDVQPFLDRDAYLSVRRIVLLDQVLGPLAGNLRIAGTTFALDRLQVGYRGGEITGQLEADLRRGASFISMRGNATGIENGEDDEVLDANFALRFAPESLALDGSLQLVRVSKSHLVGILDVLDPYHEDPDMNEIRTLLRFGYPRFARARASDGLMDFELRLGGIAGLASIQAIRAIPIAPLLDDYVAPFVDPLFRDREAPASPPAPGETPPAAPDEALPSPTPDSHEPAPAP